MARGSRHLRIKVLLFMGFLAIALVIGVAMYVLVTNPQTGQTQSSETKADGESAQPVLAVLTLFAAVLGSIITPLLNRLLGTPSENPVDRVPHAAEALARKVRGERKAQARLRRLQDPTPMDIRWTRGDACLSDHRHNVPDDESLAGAPEGHGGVAELAAAFAAHPHRRIVVLGPAGSGKSVLADRVTLAYLQRRERGRAVPVVLPISSWDVRRDGLDDWIVQCLVSQYEVLGLNAPAEDVARELLDRELILPVLDGFDQLPESVRPLAMRRLNAELDESVPVLLTSRPEAYAATVASTDVLTAATVLELLPVPLETACAYLASGAPPLRNADGELETVWAPVVHRLRNDPERTPAAALRSVISSPLMIAMARQVCDGSREDPERVPARLLEERFSTPELIERHLLDAYVPAVYGPSSGARWTARQAERRLSFLARHAQGDGGGTIAWWRLEAELPRPVRWFAPPLLAALCSGALLAVLRVTLPDVVFESFFAQDAGHLPFPLAVIPWIVGFGLTLAILSYDRPGWTDGERRRRVLSRRALLVTALVALEVFRTWQSIENAAQHVQQETRQLGLGVTAALLVAFFDARPTTSPVTLPGRDSVLAIVQRLSRGLLLGAVLGAPTGALTCYLNGCVTQGQGSPTGLPPGLGALIGGFIGCVAVLAMSVFHASGRSVDVQAVPSPERSLAQDRRTALVRALVVGLFSSLILLAADLSMSQDTRDIEQTCGYLWLYLTPATLALSAWGRLLTVRVWFGITGRLPWRLLTFLKDAHARGVLRQTGALYQFRHLRLQERLSGQPPGQG
ncbi:NACHT domain-containing protein [Streptomyces sp. uw30]|uniref:NACHT domain-containing protein n=1 Tax=Streptomyces sp. uw30 TaxID=1828179 RepID=UPI0011CD3E5D|nr:NACHT domain-containing protein [Streptomyces sp. uw30]TXS35124.1 NACHT domain-containing protein [Streptomyces sp. uw30]